MPTIDLAEPTTDPLRVHVTELPTVVGRRLGYSRWHAIDQEHIDLFARITGDRQWIHLDRGRAAASTFGGTVAHGYLTLAMAPTLTAEVLFVGGVEMQINFGLNKVRFQTPVPAGAALRATGEVLRVRDRPRGLVELVMRLRLEVSTPGGPAPACTAETVTLLRPNSS